MKKETVQRISGYDIACNNNITGNEKLAVIISHGFASSKESPTAQAALEILPRYGIGTFSFDFPAHGESPVTGEMFRVGNCVNDLAFIESHVRKLAPNAEIAYFSSSFGAYITLIYISTKCPPGRRAFLRCPAVNMSGILKRDITPIQLRGLDTQGFFTLDTDYSRPLLITRGLMEDFEAYDVFRLYRPGMASLSMIHGTADETVPIEEVRSFALHSGAKLVEIQDADHRFTVPRAMEKIMESAIKFFMA